MGIASLILGISSIFLGFVPGLGIVLGLIAIILGIVGRRRLLEEGRSSGVAMGGMVTGAFGIIGGTVSLLFCLSCLNVLNCGGSGDNAQNVNSGMDWAQQQADSMSKQPAQTPTPALPNSTAQAVPPTPAVPSTPPTPATPALPGQAGQAITVGTPLTGTFTPVLPVTPEGRPYIDYTFNVVTAGQYTFHLVSSNTDTYDPYIRLMQGPTVIEENDDGGDELNAQLQRPLVPGAYTVRVMSYSPQVSTATPFTLTVNGG